MFDLEFDMADENELADIKEWFFRENIRLTEERERLEEDKRKFELEKRRMTDLLNKKISIAKLKIVQLDEGNKLVTKKLEAIQEEYVRLVNEQKKLEQEKETFEKIKKYRRPPVQNNYTYIGSDLLFKGVDNEIALKKRYRELLKIFHPDNMGGDTSAIQSINREYDALKKMYG